MTDCVRSRATSAFQWLEAVASDQGSEMWLAVAARDDSVPQRTDGVRQKLFAEWQERASLDGSWALDLLHVL